MNTLIYLIAAAACVVLGIRGWSGDRTHPARRAFLVVAVLTGLCFGSFTLYLLPGLTPLRYIYGVAGALLPPALLSFLEEYLGPPDHRARARLRRLWLASTVLIGLFLALDLGLYAGAPAVRWPDIGLAIYTLGGLGLCIERLWREHSDSDQHVHKVRLRYLLGLLLATVLSTTLELLARTLAPPEVVDHAGALSRSFLLQGAAPPAGAVIGTTFIYFLYGTVQLYRLLDLHEVFVRILVLCAASLMLLSFGGLTVLWSEALVDYRLHVAFQVFLASALFLSVFDPLRSRLEALGFAYFNRQGHRLELALTEADAALAKVIRLDGLGDELLGRLQASGRVPLTSLYLWTPERHSYRLRLCRGPVSQPLMESIAAHPFTDGFLEGERVYAAGPLRRRVRRRLEGHEDAALRLRTLEAMDGDLCIAVMSGELVLGWLNLKSAPWSDGFSREETRRLVELVDRAAVVIENIYNYEALEEQHRLAALGTMAAGLAHEIRNPLAGIKGAAEFVRQVRGDPEAAEELDDLLDVIIDETDRLAGVVNQFLDYSRPLQVRAQPINPEELVERVFALARIEGRDGRRREHALPERASDPSHSVGTIALRCVLPQAPEPPLPEVQADPDKLLQVLLNLVHNAIEAQQGQPAGSVRVVLRSTRFSAPGRRGHPALEVLVEDDGPGIPSDDLEKLFIPFFTTKRAGTGLGLAISRRLVEAHGGDLTARSRPGGGSTFRLLLPAQLPPPAAAEQPPAAADESSKESAAPPAPRRRLLALAPQLARQALLAGLPRTSQGADGEE